MGASVLLKVLFVIVQVIFIIVGIVLIGLGSWVEVQDRTFISLFEQQFLFGPYLIIAAGCATVLVSVIGMVGALCETKINKFLLGFYAVLVGLILIAQLAGGILGFVFRAQAKTIIRNHLNTTFFMYGGNADPEPNVTETWDNVQRELQCCGIDAATDWVLNYTRVPGLNETLRFPMSCCMTNATNDTAFQCGGISGLSIAYKQGCQQAILSIVENNLLISSSVAVSTIVAELLVILMAVCLLCFSGKDD